jgi:hypothetical protein
MPYSPTKSAESYSVATGVVAGFSLAAVVLVFTISATPPPGQSPVYYHYFRGFATSMFTLGTVGSLLCAYSYGRLSGEPESSPRALDHLMLTSLAFIIPLMGLLAGFDALANVFLHHQISGTFVVLNCSMLLVLTPLFVHMTWFDKSNMIRADEAAVSQRDTVTVTQVRQADGVSLWPLIWTWLLAALAVAGGLLARDLGLFGSSDPIPYRVLTYLALLFVSGAIMCGFFMDSLAPRFRFKSTRQLAEVVVVSQLLIAGYLIALMP